MLAEETVKSAEAALRTTAARRRAAVRGSGSSTGRGTGRGTRVVAVLTEETTKSAKAVLGTTAARVRAAVGGGRSGTGRGTGGSRSCTSRGRSWSTVGSRSCTGWGATTVTTTITATICWRTATGRRTAIIAARRLDVRATTLIRVDRRATRLDDHGFTTRRGTRRVAAGLRGTTAPRKTMQKPGIRQAGHAHRGEHSTSHLDPSHRAKSPSLGNLEPGSSRPMERRCWSAEEFQAALCRLRRASHFKRLLPSPRSGHYDRQTYVRPQTVSASNYHRHRNSLTAHAAITMGTLRQLHLAGLNQWIGATGMKP